MDLIPVLKGASAVVVVMTTITLEKRWGWAALWIGIPLILAADCDLSSLRGVAYFWFPKWRLWRQLTLTPVTFNVLATAILWGCCGALCHGELKARRAQEGASYNISLCLLTLLTGYLAIAYFGYGFFLIGILASGFPELRGYFAWFVLPYIGICVLFGNALRLVHKRRMRTATTFLIGALIASVGMCIYDFQNYRYQMSGGGTGAGYCMWWWYYEPYWHGYKPGNL